MSWDPPDDKPLPRNRAQERHDARFNTAGWPTLSTVEDVAEIFSYLGLWPDVVKDDDHAEDRDSPVTSGHGRNW